jgi:hypothetical protein
VTWSIGPYRWIARGRLAILRGRNRAEPFAVNLSMVSVPVGLLSVVVGPEVSRAYTIVYHTPELIYVWGVFLLLGGLNVAYGIVRGIPSLERAGQYVLAVAWAFYGVSVVVGLGSGGMVAGPLALAVALSCLQRAAFIGAAAKVVARIGPDGT